MTVAILFIVAIPTCIVLWYRAQQRRIEREHDRRLHSEAMRYVPRCEGCDCPGHCEAAAFVRQVLREAGVEVEA